MLWIQAMSIPEARPAVVFNHTVKGFLSHVLERRDLLTPTVVDELASLGLDVRRPADLPIDAWWKVLAVGVRLIASEQTEADGWELLGGEVIHGFAETLLGKSSFLVLRLLGPRRALRQLTQQYRTADSVTHVDSIELEPTKVELIYRVTGGIPQPTYVKGLLKVGMELVGAHGVEVSFGPAPGVSDGLRYLVSWVPARAER